LISSREAAAALDADDPLRAFREQFVIHPEVVYLDGNSLGCLPKATVARLERIVAQWGERAVRGWDEGWLDLPLGVGDRLGAAVLGAAAGQTVVGDSTTVCFYKLVCAALDARPGRSEIVTDLDNFPTDRYVLEGVARARGLRLVWLDGDPETVTSVIGPQTALVTFSHVSYRSARIADMAAVDEVVRDAGALMLWDLSHSAGSVPISLDGDHAQLAVGCTYKYLNGGPGAPAYMYVRHELQAELRQPIWGWLGRRDAFGMAPGYDPAPGIGQMLSGTPSILGLTAARTGIDLSIEAGIQEIRAKSTRLTSYAIELIDAVLDTHGVSVGSPRDPQRRGGHVALVHPAARALVTELAGDHRVITDFREPDVVRFGLSPLTTRFTDIHDAVQRLVRLLATRG
jgi:kynureninase